MEEIKPKKERKFLKAVESVSEVFEVNEDLLSCDSEGLNRVLEFVK